MIEFGARSIRKWTRKRCLEYDRESCSGRLMHGTGLVWKVHASDMKGLLEEAQAYEFVPE